MPGSQEVTAQAERPTPWAERLGRAAVVAAAPSAARRRAALAMSPITAVHVLTTTTASCASGAADVPGGGEAHMGPAAGCLCGLAGPPEVL